MLRGGAERRNGHRYGECGGGERDQEAGEETHSREAVSQRDPPALSGKTARTASAARSAAEA
jgi:hypothetical protein